MNKLGLRGHGAEAERQYALCSCLVVVMEDSVLCTCPASLPKANAMIHVVVKERKAAGWEAHWSACPVLLYKGCVGWQRVGYAICVKACKARVRSGQSD